MRQLNRNLYKKGVSLITVLLFMLVATIAATATYKWITSENRSSASRMLKSEAHQSAVAGIENARAWMAYHANDVGALIKQYFDGKKKPIHLNNVLKELGGVQNYDVWLTGVDTEKNTYKLQIFSEGRTRSGTTHKEVAILNVDGLYKVKIPQEGGTINFDKAFFGSVENLTNSPTLQSGIINGNMSGNQPAVKENLLVTGDATLQGTTKFAGSDIYVKGTVKFNGNTYLGSSDTNVVYIGGNVDNAGDGLTKITGDLYVGGDWNQKRQMEVTGNATINGVLNLGDKAAKIGKNLVFTENGSIKYNTTNGVTITVGGNLYLPKKIEGFDFKDDLKNFVDVGGKIYFYDDAQIEACAPQDKINPSYYYGIYSKCELITQNGKDYQNPDNRYFSYKSENGNSHIASATMHSWKREDGVFSSIGDNYWSNIDKMNDYGKLINGDNVPQPILLDNKRAWLGQKANQKCKDLGYKIQSPVITELKGNDISTTDVFKDLNACYAKLSETNDPILYNGYMVVEFTGKSTSNMEKEADIKLNGNFIFYFNSVVGDLYVPPTESGTNVLLYLEQGGGSLFSADGSDNENNYNYLVYSEKKISFSKVKITGSVVMAENSVATIADGEVKINFNKNVLNALADAGIITENPEYTALAGGGSGGSSISTATGAYDIYYIATSPQLGIYLESQYESAEDVPETDEYTEIEPAIIVLPRIIYLTQDPIGKLSDYYKVLNLNGAKDDGNGSVSCNPSNIPTSDRLFSGTGSEISEGIYTCEYSSNNYGKIPFYVVISGTQGTTPIVSFEKDKTEIVTGSTTSHDINLIVPASSRSEEMAVDINISPATPPNGWNLTANSAVVTKRADGVYTAKFNPTTGSAQSLIKLFTISPSSDAENGSVLLQLTSPCEGCNIGVQSTHTVVMTGFADVYRKNLWEGYCQGTGSKKNVDCNALYSDYDADKWKERSCEGLLKDNDFSWVGIADPAVNVTTDDLNNHWRVGTNNTNVSLAKLSSPDYCEVYIPTENNSEQQLVNGESYTLYASVLRKKYTLNVKLEGVTAGENAEVIVKASTTLNADGTLENPKDLGTCKKSEDDGGCIFDVYAGYYVQLSLSDDSKNFSYWKCSGNNCPIQILPSDVYTLAPIKDNNSVIAKFNDTDEHCFYDDFKKFDVYCSSSDKDSCVLACESGSCPVSTNGAEWQQVKQISSPKLEWNSNALYVTATNDKNDKEISPIMRNVDAGSNGRINALFQTALISHSSEFLNTGFIFRANSDLSKYLILNVYGTESGILTARLCKGSLGNTPTNCETKTFDNQSSSQTITSNSFVTLYANVDKENVTLDAYVNEQHTTANFELKGDLAGLDVATDYNRVGISLADPQFKLYDIGWKSKDYEKECWKNPTLYCSFAANYLGGIVPKDSNVTPWVGVSSWYKDHGCAIEYWYNGYNNTTTPTLPGQSAWHQVSSQKYNFNKEGFYAITYNDPIKKDYLLENAVAVAHCSDDLKSSITYKAFTNTKENGTDGNADCGIFYVGNVQQCSQNATIFSNDTRIVSSGVSQIFESGESGSYNLRAATLNITVSDVTTSGTAIVYMTDENDVSSDIGTISIADGDGSATQTFSLNVNNLSNIDGNATAQQRGFNPEAVKSVTIATETANFIVSNIQSSCPFALGISNCSAQYNGEKWIISADFTNIEGAATNGCVVKQTTLPYLKADGSSAESKINCATEFNITDLDAYKRANELESGKNNEFLITATAKDGSEVKCETSAEIAAASLTCEISSENVVQGKGTPTFSWKATNCPSNGCKYKVTLSEGTTVAEEELGTSGSHSAQINSEDTQLEVGRYTYKVEFTEFNKSCEKPFNVTEKEKTPPSFGECSVSDDYKYSATINNPDNVLYDISFAVTDEIGNTLISNCSESKTNSSETSYEKECVPTKNGKYQYVATISYEEEQVVCTGTKEVSNIPESSSSSVAGSITATCHIEVNNSEVSSVYLNQQFEFSASSVKGPNTLDNQKMQLYYGDIYVKELDCHIKTDGSGTCWNGGNTDSPSAIGFYTYTLKYNDEIVCSKTLEVIEPSITCKVEDDSGNDITGQEIDPGKKFKLMWICDAPNKSYFGGNVLLNEQQLGQITNLNGIGSFLRQETVSGTYKYTINYWNCSSLNSCSHEIKIKDVAPTIECPDDMKAKVGETVSVTPKSLTGCADGCDYTIDGSSATGSGYTGGSLTFTGESTESTKTYTFRVTNTKNFAECSFDVTYSEDAVSSGGWICLDPKDNGGWPEIKTGISSDGGTKTYTVEHNCTGTNNYSWFYNCSGSGSVTFGSSTLTCDGSEKQASTTAMPASGSTLTLTGSVSFSKFGCEASGSTTCSGTGVSSGSGGGSTPSSSSAVVVSSSSAGGSEPKLITLNYVYSGFTSLNSGLYKITCARESGSGGNLICQNGKYKLNGAEEKEVTSNVKISDDCKDGSSVTLEVTSSNIECMYSW